VTEGEGLGFARRHSLNPLIGLTGSPGRVPAYAPAAIACPLRDAVFARNSLHLIPALVAFKDADLQIFDRMRRSSNQMRIAAALFTAKRFNKFLILHKEGMLVHNPPHLQRECRSALRRPGPRRTDGHSPHGRWRAQGGLGLPRNFVGSRRHIAGTSRRLTDWQTTPATVSELLVC
jgi:hypothetical protein